MQSCRQRKGSLQEREVKAVAVAGGEGTRLRPLTLQRAKPMVPLINQPVLVHMVRQLRRYGVTELQLTLRYMASLIQDYFQTHPISELQIGYHIEEFPLGTAGSLKQVARRWHDPFLVVSGDALTDMNFRALYEKHIATGADVTIALQPMDETHEYGVVLTDRNNWVHDFVEKPRPSEQQSNRVNTGMYILNPSVLDLIPDHQEFDFSSDLFPALLQQNRPIYGHVTEGYWCDVGNTEAYMKATRDLLHGHVDLFDTLGTEHAPGIWVGRDVFIHPTAQLTGPLFLGTEVQVQAQAVIRGPAVIRPNTIVDSHAQVEESVIWRNSYLGPGSRVQGAIIGRQCSVRAHSHVSEGCVVGDGCILEEGTILMPHVKLWPYKRIARASTIRENIVWGRQGQQELFRGFTISGQTNLDLTPETAAKIGVALGSSLPKAADVAVNSDPHMASGMIKRAIVSGLPGAGVNTLDLGSVAMPVLRHFVRGNRSVQAGLHVRVNPDDPHPQSLNVQILEANGSNLGKRMEQRIQSLFFQEDLRRVGMEDIGTTRDAPNCVEAYVADFLTKVFAEQLHTVPFKLVVDYSNGMAAPVMSTILEHLQIEAIPLNSLRREDLPPMDPDRTHRRLGELASIVKAVHAHAGVMLDVTGELVRVVDDQGLVLTPYQADALFLDLALFHHPRSRVVYPDNMPAPYTAIARAYEAEVVPCKSDMHNLMTAAASGHVLVALNGRGHFIFPFFHPAPDPMMASVKLLEYLAVRREPISHIMAGLPAINHRRVLAPAPWTQRGRVMNQFNERYQAERMNTLEGLKICTGPDEWVQLQPSAVHPALEIALDAPTRSRTLTLQDRFLEEVRRLVDQEETAPQADPA